MSDLTCIYCLRDLPAEKFNREHVISEAFGTLENNFTLLQTVCCTCNQFFGDRLEIVFGRDSFEAYDRLKHGLKRAKDIPEMPQRRLSFTAALSGELEGLRLSLVTVDGSEAVALEPQVGLPKIAHRGWTYLTEPELADRARPLPADFDRQGQVRIIAPSREAQQRFVDLLAERGVSFYQKGGLPLPSSEAGDMAIWVNMTIDPVVKRCIAKYVFNYMAYVMGREFALLRAFDATRAYIRRGKSPGHQVVVADDTPILATDSRTRRQTDGHLIKIYWTPDKRHVFGALSLFNRVTYRVCLAWNFSGLWRPIRTGHHFDLHTRSISPLIPTSLYVPGARPH